MSAKTWRILTELAGAKVSEASRQLGQVQNELVTAERRKTQILGMIAENQQRLKGTGGSAQAMADVQFIAQFLSTLARAQEGTEQEITGLLHRRSRVEQKLALARLEEKKMDSLKEREQTRIAQAQADQEQRAMDAVALAQFHRR